MTESASIFSMKILVTLISCHTCSKWATQEWAGLRGPHPHTSKPYVCVCAAFGESQLHFGPRSCRHLDSLYDVGGEGRGSLLTALCLLPLSLESSCALSSCSLINCNYCGLDVKCVSSGVLFSPLHNARPKGKEQHKVHRPPDGWAKLICIYFN